MGMGMTERRGWGAERRADGTIGVSLWSPEAKEVFLLRDDEPVAMKMDDDGFWHVETEELSSYRFSVDGKVAPDPASRLQSGGVEAASVAAPRLVPPPPWKGHSFAELSIMELHLGTFTEEGTLSAAALRLGEIAELGVTAVEVMPVAQFHGEFGWGYDGVLPYAVHPAYGTREDLRDFVAAAHDVGLSVVLDVVYNHFGPIGAHLHALCPPFFDPERSTPWGPAIDFRHRAVREFFLQNAEMWIGEFGIDGLRIDAAHQIIDPSPKHILTELSERVRAAAPDRPVHLVLEDERNSPDLRDEGYYDAQWNDDYHHSLHCLLTGEREGYYASFAVDPMADLCRALAEGHVEQGQPREGLRKPRGAPSDHLPFTAFVNANQTHDQIGNRAEGDRLISLAGPEPMRVAHALLLTSPAVPMLFMGEEIGARTPFLFFADFEGEMGEMVRDGRRAEFAAFERFASADVPDPTDPATRDRSRPYSDPPPDAENWRNLTRAALAFRREHVVPLVRSGRAAPAVVRQFGQAALFARWTFEAGVLETVARFHGGSDDPPFTEGAAMSFGDVQDGPFFATRVVT